jgi:hypothetical protein
MPGSTDRTGAVVSNRPAGLPPRVGTRNGPGQPVPRRTDQAHAPRTIAQAAPRPGTRTIKRAANLDTRDNSDCSHPSAAAHRLARLLAACYPTFHLPTAADTPERRAIPPRPPSAPRPPHRRGRGHDTTCSAALPAATRGADARAIPTSRFVTLSRRPRHGRGPPPGRRRMGRAALPERSAARRQPRRAAGALPRCSGPGIGRPAGAPASEPVP